MTLIRMTSAPIVLALSLGVALTLAEFWGGAGAAPASTLSGLGASQVVERGEDGVTFVVEIPPLTMEPVTVAGEPFTTIAAPHGFGVTTEPGLPSLPFRTFTIGVPPGHDPAATVAVLATETLDVIPAPAPEPTMSPGSEDRPDVPGYRDAIDRAFYGGAGTFPPLLFESSPLAWLRQQQIFELTVYPVRFDAAGHRLTIARRLEVRVDFRPRAGLRTAPDRLPAPTPERGFESIYRNTILNYESARRFRVGPLAEAVIGGDGGPRDEPEIKITLAASGVFRLPFDQLARRGLPAGTLISRLALAERNYADGDTLAENFPRQPVPIEVSDPNLNGVFDAGDAITFYGRSYRERVGPEPYLHRHTEKNVVWLSWTTEGGARVAVRPGWFEPTPPPAATSFPDTFHFEEDYFYANFGPRRSAAPSYTSRESVLFWYLTRHAPSESFADPYCLDSACRAFGFPFALNDIDPGQPATASVLSVSAGATTHFNTFLLVSGADEDTLARRWSFQGYPAIGLWQSDPFPGSLLARPGSSFKFVGEHLVGNVYAIGSLAFFDWFELHYRHLYRARQNRLLSNSGSSSGQTEFRIDGFSSPDSIAVYDVTDALNPVRLAGVTQEGAATVRFRDDVTSPRRYAAFARGRGEQVLDDSAIAHDDPSSLFRTEADYILVVPDPADVDGDGNLDDFPAEAERLKQHREAQGLRVQIARLSDIYDEFDGGLARAFAIRNYLRHGFSHWTRPPQYLLLGGDASEDLRNKVPTGLNVVPTEMMFGPVHGTLDLDLVTADSWFVAGLGPTDEEFDLHLDMAVGRLPAQSAAELRMMIDKTIAYESFDPGDRWRAKTLTISDDAWSSTISFTAEYQYRAQETVFDRICDSLNAMVENRSGIGDLIDTRSLKLSTYTNQLPNPHTQDEGEDHFDVTGSPPLYQLISEGNLIMNYQGHANRHLLAHERIFASIFPPFDQNSFNNLGRPGIWFLYACHPNQFGDVRERVSDLVPGGERAVGELLLAKPNSGLVASIASTGFEFLPSSGGANDLNTPQWEAFFLTPPVADPDGPRWILGEVVNLGKELYNQRSSPGTSKGPIFTYCILGDPALRIDAVPPRFEVAAADTARSPGDRLETFSASSDTVVITAEIRDEVRIDIGSIRVRERSTGGQETPVDPALWSAAYPDTARPSRLLLTYRAPLRPDNYDILLSARDANGREMEFPLAVRVDTRFRADGRPLAAGDFLTSQAEIEVDGQAPVPVASSDFRLLLDGVPLALEAEPRDPLAKDWRLRSAISTTPGNHTLAVELSHGGAPPLTQSIQLQVEAGLNLRQVGAYPNPFDDLTVFTYQLTNPADEVSIRIYTISGRLVNEIRSPRVAGFSQVRWDGRDADGNQVANGLYIFRVVARGPDAEVDFTGRLVRGRS